VSTRSRLALLLTLLAMPSLAAAAEAQAVRARPGPLELRRDGGRLLVSFRVLDGISAEDMERIHSGIAVTFRHRVEVLSHRTLPLLPDKVQARVLLESTASYDSLTKRYALHRRLESRQKGGAAEVLEQRQSTSAEQEMRAWMTELADLPVMELGRVEEQRLRVRVESIIDRRYLLFLIPWNVKVSAETPLGS
jgi:hypothetical protein